MPKRRYGKVYDIYYKLNERLPTTYPRAVLAIYKDVEELRKYFKKYYADCKCSPKRNYPPVAFCDETYVVHIPLDLKENEDDEEEMWTDHDLAKVYLHEIGHLVALKRYGKSDPKWSHHTTSEKYANDFASRWMRKLTKEGLFS